MIGLLAMLTSSAAFGEKVSYEGHSVLRCMPQNADHLKLLRTLESDNEYNLDFWVETRNIGMPVDMMVSKEHFNNLSKFLIFDNFQSYLFVQTISFSRLILNVT
jgi:hypothetical protein